VKHRLRKVCFGCRFDQVSSQSFPGMEDQRLYAASQGFGVSSEGYGLEDILRDDPTGTILSVINLLTTGTFERGVA